MALIQITTDLSRVARELKRIADALDRAFPKYDEDIEPSTEKDIHIIEYEGTKKSDDELWQDYGPRSNYNK